MKYYFTMKESQDGTKALVVCLDDGINIFCSAPNIVNVFTGDRAVELFNELTDRCKEQKDGKRETM